MEQGVYKIWKSKQNYEVGHFYETIVLQWITNVLTAVFFSADLHTLAW